MIKISIIIPVYNAGKYLFDTLQSVKMQTFTHWECICINDGSTDSSSEVINGFIAIDNRFKIIEQSNQGVSVSRNKGINNANGKYIAFLDQDDLMSTSALESLYVIAEKFQQQMVRGTRLNIADDYSLESLNTIKYNSNFKHIRSINVISFSLLPKRWMYVWMCLFRKDFLSEIRFYEPLKSGAEDNLFMFEVFNKLQGFIQIENVVCLHRKSNTSTMQNGYKLQHINTIEQAVFRFIELSGKYKDSLSRFIIRKQIRNFIYSSVYKCLDTNLHKRETQKMYINIFPIIKPFLKIKHRLIIYYFIRDKMKVAKFIQKWFVIF